MRYGRHGSLKARPGHRDEVAKMLLEAGEGLREAGCNLYLVALARDDPDTIWVSEIWSSEEAHRASLQLPPVRAAIERAMPLLTGDFSSIETSVLGGLGVPGPGEGL